MKVLITGANGFIASHLIDQWKNDPETDVLATGKGPCRLPFDIPYRQLDITRPEEVKSVVRAFCPDLVVHLAAISSVDACEANPDRCRQINVVATKHLLNTAGMCGAFFLFVSTDFVFRGDKKEYNETDVPAPVSEYGRSKYEAEQAVRQAAVCSAILRPVLVYGNSLTQGRSNFYLWVKRSLEKGEIIRVVNDQWRTPTFVTDVAGAIRKLAVEQRSGIFHVSGKKCLSVYEFARLIARKSGLPESNIQPVSSDEVEGARLRPAATCFRQLKLDISPLSPEEALSVLNRNTSNSAFPD